MAERGILQGEAEEHQWKEGAREGEPALFPLWRLAKIPFIAAEPQVYLEAVDKGRTCLSGVLKGTDGRKAAGASSREQNTQRDPQNSMVNVQPQ